MSAVSLVSPLDEPFPTRVPVVRPAERSTAIAEVVSILDKDLSPSQVRTRHLERLSISPERDERFDRITAMACTLFAVPMSTVTLVDGDLAVFPGSTGVDRSVPTRTEAGFGQYTVRHQQPLVVEDATADPRFADLATVVGPPYLRFYAGVPLDDEDGITIGSFSIFDTVPRRLDRHQLSILTQLASWARRELVDSTEMARAREVQHMLLPTSSLAPAGYELASVCRPTKGVGGDFFDHAMIRGRLFLGLVDVMGKGIGAGLLAASVRAILRASVSHQVQTGRLTRSGGESRLSDILLATDRLLRDDLGQTGTLVTGFAASIDPESGAMTWADAGHGLALIVRTDGSSVRLAGTDLPLGIGLDAGWTEHHTRLEPGDTLLVVSDGLLDLLGGTDEAFDHIRYLVQTDPEPHQLVQRITELTMLGTALDDVTAVAVRRNPVTS